MKSQSRFFLAAALIVGLGLPQAGSATVFVLRGSVIANGGQSSPPATDGTRKLFGTVEQTAVGVSQNASRVVCSGFWCFGGSRVVSVDPPGGARLPTEFALGPTTPNPTRGSTRFHLSLPRAAQVTLRVYDVAGRQVGDAVSRNLPPGEHELYWRAPSDRSGIYFLRLATDGTFKAQQTIVLVR